MRGSRSSDFEQKDAVVEIIETQNKTVLNLHEFYRFSKAWEVRSCFSEGKVYQRRHEEFHKIIKYNWPLQPYDCSSYQKHEMGH
ncbi:uncharacterized protein EAE98_005580 [Botrytis deweyae]|uniref:Clr5 domain-containing protein n=1 Tax=Botrytis deweyae TaxID=2478750 RepID=A0ABQ7IMC1_9HELO|nr:uncharacterized protein EAE98_005580 [Botrytis deweyae]KAF7928524.1 hypothetical protein EAE98_005580 [Botrytis deweyae]